MIRKLIKFGEEKYIKRLFELGELYLRPLSEFRYEDDDSFTRGDFAEGLNWTPFKNFRLIPNDSKINLNIKRAFINDFGYYSHIYSMYAIDYSFWEGKKQFAEKNLVLGETALLIDPKQFIDKVISSCSFEIKYGMVQYYELPNFPVPINDFNKRIEFNYQNEFRIAIKSKLKSPIIINLGSIEDIAEMIPSSKLIGMKFL
jgi:hypothetical protein